MNSNRHEIIDILLALCSFPIISDQQEYMQYLLSLEDKLNSVQFYSLTLFLLQFFVLDFEISTELKTAHLTHQKIEMLNESQIANEVSFIEQFPDKVDECSPLVLQLCPFIYNITNRHLIARK